MSDREHPQQDQRKLTYASYLKIDELLQLQRPLSQPVAHDEMLFIAIHQVYELWFKVILFELEDLVKQLGADNLIQSFRRLERVNEILRILVQQVDILETMTPVEFNRFRSHINPASGFQSRQFRLVEMVGGVDPAEYEKFATLEPEWADAVQSAKTRPTLRTAFFALLQRRGLIREVDPQQIAAAIHQVYLDPAPDSALRSLCEHLLRFDEQVAMWRFRHVQMVERMIGMKPGTGGSLGVAYLRTTLRKRFFPELWEARTGLGSY